MTADGANRRLYGTAQFYRDDRASLALTAVFADEERLSRARRVLRNGDPLCEVTHAESHAGQAVLTGQPIGVMLWYLPSTVTVRAFNNGRASRRGSGAVDKVDPVPHGQRKVTSANYRSPVADGRRGSRYETATTLKQTKTGSPEVMVDQSNIVFTARRHRRR